MNRTARTALALAAILGLSALTACTPHTTPATTEQTIRTLTPCATEDSDNCYWDAARQGNGQGTSFITLDGTTYYPR